MSRPAWVAASAGVATSVMLLRHGQTAMSAERRYSGLSDVPLTELGSRQAVAAAARLGDGPELPDVIVMSPLLRARQTAAAVAAACPAAAVVVADGVRETDFGKWEGCTFTEVQARWPAELEAWLGDPAVAPPDGESFVVVAERVRAALERVLAAYAGRRVLVVSHVTPIKTLVVAALGAPPAAMHRMHLDLAALSAVDYYADGPAVLRSFNDTAHLSRAPGVPPPGPPGE